MFKFSKQVDQAQQGLEEGQISDDDLQLPQRTIPVLPPQTKTKHIPHVNQQQQESAEYVIEQVKINPPSPPPDRKKDRREHRHDDKNHRQDKNIKISPDQPVYMAPMMQPIQHMPYYQYPPNMYAYPPMPEQRQPHYQPLNQPPPQMIIPPYQQNPYQQRPPVQNQWNSQMNVSPNKTSMQNNMGDYGNRHNSYVYNNNQGSSNYHMGNMNYQQPQNKYYQNMQIQNPKQNPQNYQNTQYPPQPQYPQQQQTQLQYQQQQQQQQLYNKNKVEQQKRRQEQQQARKRDKKVKEIQKKISQSVMEEEGEGVEQIGEILDIVKRMLDDDQGDDDETMEILHAKIQSSKMRSKIYDILTTLQLPKIIQKLKQKQLQRRLVELNKKKQAAELYRKMNRKDPRIKAS